MQAKDPTRYDERLHLLGAKGPKRRRRSVPLMLASAISGLQGERIGQKCNGDLKGAT